MKFIFLCVCILLTACTESTKIENMCSKLRVDYKGLQKQLPIQSDITTTLVGIESFYLASKDECFSTLTAVFDLDAFIKVVSKNEINKQEKLNTYFQSEIGKSALLDIIKNKFNKKIETNEFPTKMKGFNFKEIYSFSGVNIEKLTLEHKY